MPSRSDPKVLVLCDEMDLHADAVIECCSVRGQAVMRLNPEALLVEPYELEVSQSGSGCSGHLEWDGGRIQIGDDVRIFCRHLEIPEVASADSISEALRRAELSAGLMGFLRLLDPARWINHPDREREFDNKLVQHPIAREAGLTIPDTLVTNRPGSVRSFDEGRETIIKQLSEVSLIASAEMGYGFYTASLDLDLADPLEDLENCPSLFQHRIPKASDVRVNVVGREIFAASIDSQAQPDAAVDFRRVDDLGIEPIELPPEISRAVREIMERTALEFACFDFALQPDGTYVFLEFNPNGNWLWIELATRQPISMAIADRLVK
jgi:glutathione synthase/RimK-type ligase-like ATP-grasp enzyme